jgi:hypothetical protein
MSIKVWAHGDKPTAAQMNEYKTVLDGARVLLEGNTFALPAEHMSESAFGLIHCYRYLHFASTGTLHDIQSAYPDVSLSEDSDGHGVLDLNSLGWLNYGRLYEVTGVTWCQESVNP